MVSANLFIPVDSLVLPVNPVQKASLDQFAPIHETLQLSSPTRWWPVRATCAQIYKPLYLVSFFFLLSS